MSSEQLRLFDKVRIYLDEDYSSAEKFTALGSFYFVHQSLTDVLTWDFKGEHLVVWIERLILVCKIFELTWWWNFTRQWRPAGASYFDGHQPGVLRLKIILCLFHREILCASYWPRNPFREHRRCIIERKIKISTRLFPGSNFFLNLFDAK
jgi:hypothetical protein